MEGPRLNKTGLSEYTATRMRALGFPTARDLSRASGIPEMTLSRILRGNYETIKVDVLIALATVLETSVDTLLSAGGIQMPTPDPSQKYAPIIAARAHIAAMVDILTDLTPKEAEQVADFARFLTTKTRTAIAS